MLEVLQHNASIIAVLQDERAIERVLFRIDLFLKMKKKFYRLFGSKTFFLKTFFPSCFPLRLLPSKLKVKFLIN